MRALARSTRLAQQGRPPQQIAVGRRGGRGGLPAQRRSAGAQRGRASVQAAFDSRGAGGAGGLGPAGGKVLGAQERRGVGCDHSPAARQREQGGKGKGQNGTGHAGAFTGIVAPD